MAISLSGSFTLTTTEASPPQTSADWAGQWSMEGADATSNFHYRSRPASALSVVSHPSGRKYQLPTQFQGTFDVQQNAVVEPPTPARTEPIEETDILLTYKFLRGANDPNVAQLTVVGTGSNMFGSFQLAGTLDLQGTTGTMMLTKGYVLIKPVAPKAKQRSSGRAFKVPPPTSSAVLATQAKPKAKPKQKPKAKASTKRKRGSKALTTDELAAKKKKEMDKAAATALMRLGLKVAPNVQRLTRQIDARSKLLQKQYTDMMKCIERCMREDKYAFFSSQEMHAPHALFQEFHQRSTFPRYLEDIRQTCLSGGYVRVMHTCRDEVGEPGTGGVGKASQVASSYAKITFDVGMKVMARSQRYRNTKKKTAASNARSARNASNAEEASDYFAGKIMDYNTQNGLYLVHFLKWQSKFDEWLSSHCLRLTLAMEEEEEDDEDVDVSFKSTRPGGCRVCEKDDDYAHIILCDRCDAEYHLYCLQPVPLETLPSCLWFCADCVATGHGWNDVTKEPREMDWHAMGVDVSGFPPSVLLVFSSATELATVVFFRSSSNFFCSSFLGATRV